MTENEYANNVGWMIDDTVWCEQCGDEVELDPLCRTCRNNQIMKMLDAERANVEQPKCVYCDDSKRDAEGMRSFDAILVPTHCGQCGRKFDDNEEWCEEAEDATGLQQNQLDHGMFLSAQDEPNCCGKRNGSEELNEVQP